MTFNDLAFRAKQCAELLLNSTSCHKYLLDRWVFNGLENRRQAGFSALNNMGLVRSHEEVERQLNWR